MFWTTLIITPSLLFFGKKVIDYYYPGDLGYLAMKIGWNALELCTKIEMYSTQLYTKYMPKAKPQPRIKFIHDGDEIMNYTFDDFLKYKKNDAYDSTDYASSHYDFILYEIPIEPKDNYEKYDNYVLRYQNINDIIAVIELNSLKCLELNMIQITVNDSAEYSIDLGRNQYMIIGNIVLDRPFLKWYLNTYCSTILAAEDKYIVTFIDHNMNYIHLPEYCYLLIKNKNYVIVNEINDI
jgi:hypothetical protein